MGAEVCAKTCFKRYVPKRLLGMLDPGTGRDGMVVMATLFNGNLQQSLLLQSIARISKAICNGNALLL